ncbi:hypothetical protein LINPERHAP1_LOCUS4560, partial [Linum perenne]
IDSKASFAETDPRVSAKPSSQPGPIRLSIYTNPAAQTGGDTIIIHYSHFSQIRLLRVSRL